MQGGESSLAIFTYHLLGTPQDRWTGRAWYGGAVLALKVVWSQSETSPEYQTVLILLFPLSPAQSGGFHMSKPGKSKKLGGGQAGRGCNCCLPLLKRGLQARQSKLSSLVHTEIASHSLWPLSQGKCHLDISKMHFHKTMVKPWHRQAVTSHPWSSSELSQTNPERPDLVLWVLLWAGLDQTFSEVLSDSKIASADARQLPTPGRNSDGETTLLKHHSYVTKMETYCSPAAEVRHQSLTLSFLFISHTLFQETNVQYK